MLRPYNVEKELATARLQYAHSILLSANDMVTPGILNPHLKHDRSDRTPEILKEKTEKIDSIFGRTNRKIEKSSEDAHAEVERRCTHSAEHSTHSEHSNVIEYVNSEIVLLQQLIKVAIGRMMKEHLVVDPTELKPVLPPIIASENQPPHHEAEHHIDRWEQHAESFCSTFCKDHGIDVIIENHIGFYGQITDNYLPDKEHIHRDILLVAVKNARDKAVKTMHDARSKFCHGLPAHQTDLHVLFRSRYTILQKELDEGAIVFGDTLKAVRML